METKTIAYSNYKPYLITQAINSSFIHQHSASHRSVNNHQACAVAGTAESARCKFSSS